MTDRRRTRFEDRDGAKGYVEAAFGSGSDDTNVFVHTDRDGLWVDARELIAAVEKAAGIEPLVVPSLEGKVRAARDAAALASVTDLGPSAGAPTPTPFVEVQYRPTLAAEVTKDFVLWLRDNPGHPRGRELEPRFCPSSGLPRGVSYMDRHSSEQLIKADQGWYVVLRYGQEPQALREHDYKGAYQEVSAA